MTFLTAEGWRDENPETPVKLSLKGQLWTVTVTEAIERTVMRESRKKYKEEQLPSLLVASSPSTPTSMKEP